jgi:predicted amidohydrolase
MKLKVATVQMTTDDRDKARVIVATAADRECVTVTTIDLAQIDEVKYRYPLMLQRRPSMYGLIARDQ